MKTLRTSSGTVVSYSKEGSGPPLVLVHGAFSDHETNWTSVAPLFRQRFSVYAIARRGRGATTPTIGHTLEEEAQDVVEVVGAIGSPVFLLGHSYGAHCALLAAAQQPHLIRGLVLYEPPWPDVVNPDALAALEALAAGGAWDQFAYAFFATMLRVPVQELDLLRASELWNPIVADAPASLQDLRAVRAYQFDPHRFSSVAMPVMLQVGSESPRHLWVTDALAAVLPDARIGLLAGQAHEGMTTAPELYKEVTTRFLLGQSIDEEFVVSRASNDA
jgi:pimeloyl-ACP methyl ester carboxylesterase